MNPTFEQQVENNARERLETAFPYNATAMGGQAIVRQSMQDHIMETFRNPPPFRQWVAEPRMRATDDSIDPSATIDIPSPPEASQTQIRGHQHIPQPTQLTNAQLDEFYERLVRENQRVVITPPPPWGQSFTEWPNQIRDVYTNLDAVEERASAARSPRESGTMKEIRGNMWEQEGYDAICITTNGYYTSKGLAIMGRGCALEAAKMWPELPALVGKNNQTYGQRTDKMINPIHLGKKVWIMNFPVKPRIRIFDGRNAVRHMEKKFQVGQTIPGWACKAEIDIIREAARRLRDYADSYTWKRVLLPRPGKGDIPWSEVKAELERILDHRFAIITH